MSLRYKKKTRTCGFFSFLVDVFSVTIEENQVEAQITMQAKRTTLAKSVNRKVVGLHLLATLLVGCGLAVIALQYWFPLELGQLAGGVRLLVLFAVALLVCGPLLTALLYRSTKTRRALLVDAFLIAFLQGTALVYGLYALAQARPLALVFETDRFRLVTYADIPVQALPSLKPWTSPWSLGRFVMAGIRPAESEQERAQRFDDMMADISPSQRPIYWRDLGESIDEIQRRARPLADLHNAYPDQRQTIDLAVSKEMRAEQVLVWLPLVSRHSLEWVVVLDANTFEPVFVLPLDGFI